MGDNKMENKYNILIEYTCKKKTFIIYIIWFAKLGKLKTRQKGGRHQWAIINET